MELTSAPLHKGQVSWRGLLLTVSLLTYWDSPTAALHLSAKAFPPVVAVGNNFLLVAYDLPLQFNCFYWYKEDVFIASYAPGNNSTVYNDKYKDKTTMYNNGSLLFRNVSKDEGGRYRAKLTDLKLDNRYYSLDIKVFYAVTPPFIQINQTIDNDRVSMFLKCPSIDIDNSITWLYNGEIVRITNRITLTEYNSILQIVPARREDSGYYQCLVSNLLGSDRSPLTQVDVIEPVIKPSIQFTDTTVKDLTSVILKCLSNDPGISIHWLFKGHSLRITNEMKLSSNNSTLEIVPARSSHSGDYQCEVSNQVSSKRSDPIQVDIIDPVTPPSVHVTNNTVKVLTSVFLTCLSNDTGVSISWLFKGQSVELTDRMKLSQNNSTLQIDSARIEDSGDYQCEVSNQVSSKRSDPIQVDIIEPVTKPSIQFTNTTVKGLTSVFLNCLTNDTGISIHWLFKGHSLRITNSMRLSPNNSTLEIVPARSSHSGDYQCEVSNQVSSQRSDPIQVDIIEPVIKPSIQFTNTTVKDLTSVILKCLSNDPGISIHWLFKGHSLRITNEMKLSSNNSTLEIVPARSWHSGDYQCEVSNQVSSKRSDPIQVDIIDPVTPPSVHVTNNTVKVLTSVFLTCLSNDTGVSIRWLFKGQSVELTDRMKLSQNNSTLQIDSARIEDSGDYQCEVSNQVSSKRSDPIQVDIIEPVTKPSIQFSNTTVKGLTSVFLNCLTNDTGISIHWLFKGHSLTITNRMRLSPNNSTLEIVPARSSHSGDYQCEVSNQVSSQRSDPIQVDIIEPVIKPSIQFTNTTVKDLTSVILKCLSNDPGISIHWLFKGHSLRITNEMKLSSNNSTLEIVPARSWHSGDYQCEVSNQVSSKRSDPIQVDIIDPVTPPSVHVTNNTVKVLTSVFLTCLSNDTGVSIRWLFKGQSVELTDRMKLSQNNSTLQIDSARIEDSGDYQCEVSNQVSSKRSDPIQVDIIEPVTKPSIQFSNTTVKGLTSVFLNCLTNDTGISIHWLFKGHSLTITNRMRLSPNNSTLEIVPARSSHSGDYQCEVSNQVSSQRSDPIQVDIIDHILIPNMQYCRGPLHFMGPVNWLRSLRVKDSRWSLHYLSTDPVTPPSIQVTNTTVKDMLSVFLNCLSNNTGISIHWLFKGQSVKLTDRMKLSHNNRTLQIDSVRIEDSGDYQCEVSNQVSSRRSHPIELDIIGGRRLSLQSIIGIIAQCLMGLIAVIFVLVFLWRRHHGRTRTKSMLSEDNWTHLPTI
ncbi:cell adhesion molecule CEACAM5-like isoform X4 [Peromyscus maniculatus bairdii]|uniref:cell adhesion molecule CEACAM5-like isoform X4 n=1 Tax=Peromyscus maniculatus bairdii TaxID=230844 RepID=UPI003FD30EA4